MPNVGPDCVPVWVGVLLDRILDGDERSVPMGQPFRTGGGACRLGWFFLFLKHCA